MDHQGKLFNHPEEEFSTEGVRIHPVRKYHEFKSPTITAVQALTLAGMAWDVEAQVAFRGQFSTLVQGKYYLARKDTNELLGEVTDKYSVRQNKSIAHLFDSTSPIRAFRTVSAGETASGKLWMAAESPISYEISGSEDKITFRIIIDWRHDGKTAITFRQMVYFPTTDTYMVGVRGSAHPTSIPHTKPMEEVRDSFDRFATEAVGDIDGNVDLFKRMARVKIPDMQDFISPLFPIKPKGHYTSDLAFEKAEARAHESVFAIFAQHRDGCGYGRMPGSFWSVMCAISETVDHTFVLDGNKDYVDYAILGAGAKLKYEADRRLAYIGYNSLLCPDNS